MWKRSYWGNLIPNWYGKGETGTISYSWKRTDGSTVGSLKQLAEIRPVRDQEFLFTVTYTPKKARETMLSEFRYSRLIARVITRFTLFQVQFRWKC